MLLDKDKPYVILSFGRSGSVLISQLFKTWLDTEAIFVKQWSLNPVKLQHTHLMFSGTELDPYVRVFCMRRDIVECMLSFILCEQYKYWHHAVDEPVQNYQPFEYNDWSLLNALCQGYCDWHHFYQSQLRSQDLVLYLEDLKPRLPNPCPFFHETYPDKRQLIQNYDEVVDYIKKFLPMMQISIGPFARHVNPVDAYSVIV
jgi:hypothetical protein